MEVSTINTALGQRAGVLRLVFGLLPPRDLKNVVLVCQLWREVGEAPGLWAWVVIRVTRDNVSTMPERLDCRRMWAVRELRVEWGVEVSEEVLMAVARHQGLRVVELKQVNLSSVDPGLLARVVGGLEEVVMCSRPDTRLTVQQWEAIFTAISEGGCKLKRLVIYGNNLSRVDPGLLARALTRVEEVVMYQPRLTGPQQEAILTAISSGDSRLKKLDIEHNKLSTVDPSLLASAVNRLEKVKILGGQLTVEQVAAILTRSLLETSLRRLEMWQDWRDWQDQDLVARARLAIGYIL